MRNIIVLLIIFIAHCFAIFEDWQSGARVEGMGSAFTAVADDASAIQFNPAGLNQIDKILINNQYKLIFGGIGVNLHNGYINLAYPINKTAGVVGISLQEMGIAMHSEKIITLAHGFNLIEDIAFGYNIHGYSLTQRDFGTGYSLGIDFGVLTRIYQRWRAGFFVHNINNPKMGSVKKYNLPRLLNFGIAYRPTYGITSSLDISKEVGQPTRILVGQEFQIIENYLTLRAGIQTEPIRFAFGLRSGVKNISVDYAMTTHPELPITHNFGITIGFK
ncbi:MAG: UPF0164 family protein [candidate division WOR-3 bacterium]